MDPAKILRDRATNMKVNRAVLKEEEIKSDEGPVFPSLDPPEIKSAEATKKPGRGFNP
jgi:hypothetical protein